MFLISLIDMKPSPNLAHLVSWIVALVLEIVLLGISVAIYTSEHPQSSTDGKVPSKVSKGITFWEIWELVIDLLRITCLAASITFWLVFVALSTMKQRANGSTEEDHEGETAALLNEHRGENGTTNGQTYGSTEQANGKRDQPQPEAWSRPDKVPSKSWWEYLRGYSLFFPYLWPAKSLKLQITVIICFAIVLIQRVLNVLVPTQVGVITDILSGEDGEVYIPWLQICLFILYKFLQGGQGVMGAIRSTLWIPISQYSYQELSTAAFEHVHGLSLDFHLGKKTGEVLSALSKGNSINTFLEQVTFSVVPMLMDLAVAVAFFLYKFDAYYALVVAIVTFGYLYITIRLAQWRTEIRRDMVNCSRTEDAVKNDSMVSYETVKYFNAEGYEFKRYRGAVQNFQKAEYKVLVSLNIMNLSQNAMFTLGLLVTCFLAAYQVASGQQRVGKFVTLLTYMAQLQGPLNFFGTFYRSIQSAMINSERMLELFKERPTVVDSPNAMPLEDCKGEITFNAVEFAYDARKPALNGVRFRCVPGTTTALVGESGGGKSTIFRLLFRFYNASAGSIEIDGHDVKDITIDSLRRHIGVVPQDTVLFNETLMYNLRYANPDVSDETVYEACKAASIHDKILSFPDGYNSRVGERGLKLSGGEKQRVAIARTIIKDPQIILLDEATAALDSETEMHIQEALDKLSQGRTTLVIAHRLSTITTADKIVVLHAGQVAESGTHDQLLALKGRYANMWRKQIRAQKAAEQAKVATDRAEQLKNEIQENDSASPSEDERGHGVIGEHRRGMSNRSGLATPLTEVENLDYGMLPVTAAGGVNSGHHTATSSIAHAGHTTS